MPRMGKHSPAEAASKRARACAWAVFVSMAGTTMSFQVYHSIERGHLPPALAVLYGVVPLFISMLLIEVISGWESAPKWIRGAAYLIIAGSMYLSAAATGAVVLKAAPPHSSLLFGLLLDGAAILAARFLMTGTSRAAKAELAALEQAAQIERAARLEAEEEAEAALSEAQAALDAEREEKAALTARLEAAQQQLEEAAQERHKDRPVPPRTPRRSAAPRSTKSPEAQAAEVVIRTEAELILDAEPGISGSELGRRLNVQPGYGRRLKRELTQAGRGGGQ